MAQPAIHTSRCQQASPAFIPGLAFTLTLQAPPTHIPLIITVLHHWRHHTLQAGKLSALMILVGFDMIIGAPTAI